MSIKQIYIMPFFKVLVYLEKKCKICVCMNIFSCGKTGTGKSLSSPAMFFKSHISSSVPQFLFMDLILKMECGNDPG